MKAKQSLCITPSESQRKVEPLPQLGGSLSSNCAPPSLPLNPYRGHSPAWLPAVEFCRYCPLRYRCSTFSSWARVSSTPQASSPAECSVALRGRLGSYISLPTPTWCPHGCSHHLGAWRLSTLLVSILNPAQLLGSPPTPSRKSVLLPILAAIITEIYKVSSSS